MAAPENLAVQADKAAPESLDVIETPTSPSSGLALSRFEFETGKANDGTKILMVEWDGSVGKAGGVGQRNAEARGGKGSEAKWEISWDGKPGILQVRDDSDDDGSTCRVYFLLPPGAAVPPLVTIARKGDTGSTDSASNSSVLRTKPMPAIFPAELGGDEGAGRRGVLHTIWAKKRLAELEAEIAAEMKENGESVGLEMAIQEKQWIVDHFGLKSEHGASEPTALRIPQASISPISPKSPVGGRLGERLRGLKLATSPSGLAAATHAAKSAQPRIQPLLPLAPPNASTGRALSKDSSNGAVASLDAIVGTKLPPGHADVPNENNEDELFALPMSPRSPEMKRSPFSLL